MKQIIRLKKINNTTTKLTWDDFSVQYVAQGIETASRRLQMKLSRNGEYAIRVINGGILENASPKKELKKG